MTYSGAVLENGQFITQASQSAPQITAAGDTTTGFYQSASGTWKYESGGTNITQLSGSGLTMLSGSIVSPNINLTSSAAAAAVGSGVSYGGTVTNRAAIAAHLVVRLAVSPSALAPRGTGLRGAAGDKAALIK